MALAMAADRGAQALHGFQGFGAGDGVQESPLDQQQLMKDASTEVVGAQSSGDSHTVQLIKTKLDEHSKLVAYLSKTRHRAVETGKLLNYKKDAAEDKITTDINLLIAMLKAMPQSLVLEVDRVAEEHQTQLADHIRSVDHLAKQLEKAKESLHQAFDVASGVINDENVKQGVQLINEVCSNLRKRQLVRDITSLANLEVLQGAVFAQVTDLLRLGSVHYVKTCTLHPQDVQLSLTTGDCVGKGVQVEVKPRSADAHLWDKLDIQVQDETATYLPKTLRSKSANHRSADEIKILEFVPRVAGKHTVTMRLYNEHVAGSPLSVVISAVGTGSLATLPQSVDGCTPLAAPTAILSDLDNSLAFTMGRGQSVLSGRLPGGEVFAPGNGGLSSSQLLPTPKSADAKNIAKAIENLSFKNSSVGSVTCDTSEVSGRAQEVSPVSGRNAPTPDVPTAQLIPEIPINMAPTYDPPPFGSNGSVTTSPDNRNRGAIPKRGKGILGVAPSSRARSVQRNSTTSTEDVPDTYKVINDIAVNNRCDPIASVPNSRRRAAIYDNGTGNDSSEDWDKDAAGDGADRQSGQTADPMPPRSLSHTHDAQISAASKNLSDSVDFNKLTNVRPDKGEENQRDSCAIKPDLVQMFKESGHKGVRGERKLCLGMLNMDLDEEVHLAAPLGACNNHTTGDWIICDSNHNCVKVYQRDGTPHTLLLGTKSKEAPNNHTTLVFQKPSAVVMLDKGAASKEKMQLFAVKDDTCVQVFSAQDCKFLRKIGDGTLFRPRGLTLDRDGNLVTLQHKKGDRNRYEIISFDPLTGELVHRDDYKPLLAGRAPPMGGSQARPSGPNLCFMDANDEICIVSDLGTHRCYVTSIVNGEEIGRFGTFGKQPGAFNFPSGVAIDGANNFLVADAKNNRIQLFDQNGEFVCVLRLDQPATFTSDICLTNDGQLMVVGRATHIVQIFNLLPDS